MMSTKARNPYVVLGVMPGTSDNGLKAAYREQALRHHPDRNPGCSQAERSFKEVNDAYARLTAGGREGQIRRQAAADDLYAVSYPSMFYDLFGVRKMQMEGTVDHVMRAVSVRIRGPDLGMSRLSV